MGIWGTGNFDRDDALDVLASLYDHIVKEIRDTFAEDSEETIYDDLGESHIIPHIDIISTLVERYKSSPYITTEEARKWKQDYLTTFDNNIHQYSDSPEYITERREVVIETFDKLLSVIEQFNL
jgi:hypothetical protein